MLSTRFIVNRGTVCEHDATCGQSFFDLVSIKAGVTCGVQMHPAYFFAVDHGLGVRITESDLSGFQGKARLTVTAILIRFKQQQLMVAHPFNQEIALDRLIRSEVVIAPNCKLIVIHGCGNYNRTKRFQQLKVETNHSMSNPRMSCQDVSGMARPANFDYFEYQESGF